MQCYFELKVLSFQLHQDGYREPRRTTTDGSELLEVSAVLIWLDYPGDIKSHDAQL